MTPADLAAIAARLDAIPPLPLVRHRHAGRYGIWMDDHGDLRFVASVNDNHGAYLDMFLNAPADIRALLDEVKRLRADCDEMQRAAERAAAAENANAADLAADKVERDALRTLLAEAREALYGHRVESPLIARIDAALAGGAS